MKKMIIPLLVVGTALIAGCDQKATTESTTATPIISESDAVAVVNGQYIPKSRLAELENEAAERSHGQTFPKEQLIEELIQRELLVQDAIQKQLDKSAEVIAQLDSAKVALLQHADIQNFIKANPVTDAEVKAEYDSKVGGKNGTEYKARHILVKTEEEAKKLIAELDKGGDFAKLANKNSLDAKESQNGGDLPWLPAGQFVAPFSEALVKLEKGKYTKMPVQTQYGWHIILREDSRAQTPPSLDAVKERLMPYLQRKKVQNMVETLRKQAKVKILVPLTEEPPKAPAGDKAATEQPVAEDVVVEEVKDASGKTVAEGVVVEEVVEEKAPAEATPAEKAAATANAVEKKVEKAATEAADKVEETAKGAERTVEKAATEAADKVEETAKAAEKAAKKAVSSETKK